MTTAAASSVDPEFARALKQASTRLVFEKVKATTASELSEDLLARLFDERIVAIHVKGFVDPRIARRASEAIVSSKAVRWFLDGQDTDMSYVKELGVPGRESEANTPERKHYHDTAVPNLRRVRALFAPAMSPVDKLRLELDELWPKGANLFQTNGQKYGAAIVRVMRPDRMLEGSAQTAGLCHIDDLLEKGKPRLFSACIYLRVPPRGGELAIWGLTPSRRHRRNLFYRLVSRGAFLPGAQDAIHEIIGPPRVTLRPGVGDLIIFDTARPHAVRGFTSGDRVQSQSFVAFQGREAPLAVYA